MCSPGQDGGELQVRGPVKPGHQWPSEGLVVGVFVKGAVAKESARGLHRISPIDFLSERLAGETCHPQSSW